jgi:hypothetical protein
VLATFLLTGGREAEILGLEVADMSFDREIVTCRPKRLPPAQERDRWHAQGLAEGARRRGEASRVEGGQDPEQSVSAHLGTVRPERAGEYRVEQHEKVLGDRSTALRGEAPTGGPVPTGET